MTEPIKRRFVERLVVFQIGRALMSGDAIAAARLRANSYYPPAWPVRPKVLFQRFCLNLPDPIGRRLYRWVWSLNAYRRRNVHRG